VHPVAASVHPYGVAVTTDAGRGPGGGSARPRPTLIVDGNNVMGAGAGGWWRDPPAAVRRLLERLVRYRAATGRTVVLVLDRPQRGLTEGDHDGVDVRYAARRGRDAGDDRVRQLLADHGDPSDVEVVTSDRALATDARAVGATVTGAGAFLAQLDEARA
jgi:predicted RNA-binding protein with PIN domain